LWHNITETSGTITPKYQGLSIVGFWYLSVRLVRTKTLFENDENVLPANVSSLTNGLV